jgi:serine/threonine-protein kinase
MTQTTTERSVRTFKIHACVGRGGYGEVYRATMFAEDADPVEVAVKVLHQDIGTVSQPVQRLRDERRMLAAVRHESILAVHDLVVIEGRIGLVTEWVEGQDLSKCYQEDDPIPLRACVEVVGRMADALHTAHHAEVPGRGTLGLIHRDVKPSNIRIGRDATAKLLDFGIARAENLEREAKTSADAVFGSFPYIPPERFLHATSAAEGDVYALGATLFEAVARDRLWRLPLREIYAVVRSRARFDRELETRLLLLHEAPPAVLSLISDMVAWDADDRPTAEEVRERCRILHATLEGPDLAQWCREHDWPELRIFPGLLSGRVFVEDAIDPLSADNIGRELGWDANDQPMTVQFSGFPDRKVQRGVDMSALPSMPPTEVEEDDPLDSETVVRPNPFVRSEPKADLANPTTETTEAVRSTSASGRMASEQAVVRRQPLGLLRVAVMAALVVGAMALVFAVTFSVVIALLQSFDG